MLVFVSVKNMMLTFFTSVYLSDFFLVMIIQSINDFTKEKKAIDMNLDHD